MPRLYGPLEPWFDKTWKHSNFFAVCLLGSLLGITQLPTKELSYEPVVSDDALVLR